MTWLDLIWEKNGKKSWWSLTPDCAISTRIVNGKPEHKIEHSSLYDCCSTPPGKPVFGYDNDHTMHPTLLLCFLGDEDNDFKGSPRHSKKMVREYLES